LLSEAEHEDGDEDVFKPECSTTPLIPASTRLNHVRLSKKLSIILGENDDSEQVNSLFVFSAISLRISS
jgi:hypothetical protein